MYAAHAEERKKGDAIDGNCVAEKQVPLAT
jgi:hypothetical protein